MTSVVLFIIDNFIFWLYREISCTWCMSCVSYIDGLCFCITLHAFNLSSLTCPCLHIETLMTCSQIHLFTTSSYSFFFFPLSSFTLLLRLGYLAALQPGADWIQGNFFHRSFQGFAVSQRGHWCLDVSHTWCLMVFKSREFESKSPHHPCRSYHRIPEWWMAGLLTWTC